MRSPSAPTDEHWRWGPSGGGLLDADTGKVRQLLKEQSVAVSLAFSPDGALVGVASRAGWPGRGAGVRLWETATGKPVGDFHPLLRDPPNPQLHFLDEGRRLLVFRAAELVLLYDGRTSRPCAAALPPGRIHEVAIPPVGATVVMKDNKGVVFQWDLEAGKRVGEPMAPPAPVTRMMYSPDGKVVEADWHETQARNAEATGNTRALLWQLERLDHLRPGDWRVAARRGAALARTGDYAAAEAAFAEAVRRGAGAELRERLAHEAALARNLGREELARWYRER